MQTVSDQPTVAPVSSAKSTASGHPVWLLVHVPKCAGLTVEEHLRKHLPPDELLDPARRKAPARFFTRPYYTLPRTCDYRKIHAVIGHFFGRSIIPRFSGREIRQCMMIRDPLGYLISHYNYRMNRYVRKGGNRFAFELWYKTRPLNPISHFILNRYLEIPNATLWRMSARDRLALLDEALAGFTFVASFQACNDFLSKLSGELGVSPAIDRCNVTHKLVTENSLPASLRQQIVEENALDTALFEKYQDRGWSPTHVGPSPGTLSDDRWGAISRDLTRPVHVVRARLLRDVVPKAKPDANSL